MNTTTANTIHIVWATKYFNWIIIKTTHIRGTSQQRFFNNANWDQNMGYNAVARLSFDFLLRQVTSDNVSLQAIYYRYAELVDS